MTHGQMKKVEEHFIHYFEQDDYIVLHNNDGKTPHIDVLLFEPNLKYPFWKLVTMGASDYKMPGTKTIDRNEYMMFVNKEVKDPSDISEWTWYYGVLMDVATYARENSCMVSYAHSVDICAGENSDMVSTYLTFPEALEDPAVLQCKLGLNKKAFCLQVLPITQAELDALFENGIDWFESKIHPENGECYCFAEPKRTKRFI